MACLGITIPNLVDQTNIYLIMNWQLCRLHTQAKKRIRRALFNYVFVKIYLAGWSVKSILSNVFLPFISCIVTVLLCSPLSEVYMLCRRCRNVSVNNLNGVQNGTELRLSNVQWRNWLFQGWPTPDVTRHCSYNGSQAELADTPSVIS